MTARSHLQPQTANPAVLQDMDEGLLAQIDFYPPAQEEGKRAKQWKDPLDDYFFEDQESSDDDDVAQIISNLDSKRATKPESSRGTRGARDARGRGRGRGIDSSLNQSRGRGRGRADNCGRGNRGNEARGRGNEAGGYRGRGRHQNKPLSQAEREERKCHKNDR
mmetsp:Transcript_41117/g.53966  ORF Transcript_41117/g.53966 Transcript_41117/m.53966 type:complete len:164 (-) Transcript_41117:2891-3382(-)